MTQRKAVVPIEGKAIGGNGQSFLSCRTFNGQAYITEFEGKLTKADVENAARAIVEERTGKMDEDAWLISLQLYHEMVTEFPGYAKGRAMVPDAMREARAVIKSLGLEVED